MAETAGTGPTEGRRVYEGLICRQWQGQGGCCVKLEVLRISLADSGRAHT